MKASGRPVFYIGLRGDCAVLRGKQSIRSTSRWQAGRINQRKSICG